MYIAVREEETGDVIIEGCSPEDLIGGKPQWYTRYGDKVMVRKEISLKKGKLTLELKGLVSSTIELIKQLNHKNIKEYLEKHPEHQKELEGVLMSKMLEE